MDDSPAIIAPLRGTGPRFDRTWVCDIPMDHPLLMTLSSGDRWPRTMMSHLLDGFVRRAIPNEYEFTTTPTVLPLVNKRLPAFVLLLQGSYAAHRLAFWLRGLEGADCQIFKSFDEYLDFLEGP